jgi:hypothetical protein
MDKAYENLPPELKLLSDKHAEPYDDGYDYNKDFQIFFRYEKEVRGLKALDLFTLTDSGNYACYKYLSTSYPKHNKGGSTLGVFF